MQGYPLTEYNNITCSGNYSFMDNPITMDNFKWDPIIKMKEELINHMKSSDDCNITLNENDQKYLDNISSMIIEFMETFKKQESIMNTSEIEMNKIIEENKKDIDILNTFISFLTTINDKCQYKTDNIHKEIVDISNDIKNNSKIKEMGCCASKKKKKASGVDEVQ